MIDAYNLALLLSKIACLPKVHIQWLESLQICNCNPAQLSVVQTISRGMRIESADERWNVGRQRRPGEPQPEQCRLFKPAHFCDRPIYHLDDIVYITRTWLKVLQTESTFLTSGSKRYARIHWLFGSQQVERRVASRVPRLHGTEQFAYRRLRDYHDAKATVLSLGLANTFQSYRSCNEA